MRNDNSGEVQILLKLIDEKKLEIVENMRSDVDWDYTWKVYNELEKKLFKTYIVKLQEEQ